MAIEKPHSVDLLTAPLFYGALFNWALLGSLCIQLYFYTLWYVKTDKKLLIVLAYGVFIVEIVQTFFTTHMVHTVLITQWGDIAALSTIPWSGVTIPITGGMISCTVQLFFSWRIKVLGGRPIFTVVSIFMALLSLTQLSAGLAFGIMGADPGYARDLNKIAKFTAVAEVYVIGAFSCDALIAIVLSYILWTMKSHSMKRTGGLLNTIIIRTIQSGTITAVVSCVEIVFFLRMPRSYVYLTPAYTVSKLYSNILFANLNGRQRMRDQAQNPDQFFNTHPIVLSSSVPGATTEGASIFRFYAQPRETQDDQDVNLDNMYKSATFSSGDIDLAVPAPVQTSSMIHP
ncbi:hypothetical protein BDZ89DRAFT_1158870 [Hymenopellis radicata]|nr:hypothetical protein BDZ89DRAFT_1158870 [Hymenopellis radicata]